MLNLAIIFLMLAVIAALFGFGFVGATWMFALMAKFAFFILVAFFIISLTSEIILRRSAGDQVTNTDIRK